MSDDLFRQMEATFKAERAARSEEEFRPALLDAVQDIRLATEQCAKEADSTHRLLTEIHET